MTADHRLGRQEARRRLEEKLRVVRERHGHRASELTEAWDDGTLTFGFKVLGMQVNGSMVIQDSQVRLAAEVPLALVVFKKRIKQRILSELGDLLADGASANP